MSIDSATLSDLMDENAVDEDVQVSPSVLDANWTEYALSLLRDNEVVKKGKKVHPKCDGLRRLVEHLIGPILEERSTSISPASKPGEICTVTAAIVVRIKNPSHPAYESEGYGVDLVVEDSAECGPHNNDPKYAVHAASTATTQAKSRCFKIILRLVGVHSEEEMSEGNAELISGEPKADVWSPEEQITDTQLGAINAICKRLDIDAMAYVNSGSTTYDSPRDIPKTTAAIMIETLSDIQREARKPPKDVEGYKKGWML